MTVKFAHGVGVGARAQQHSVHLAPTDIYYRSKPAANEFMLGLCAIGERTIREAVERIARA